jgi:DNA invertase Pin-like site-specific DNA recombinase
MATKARGKATVRAAAYIRLSHMTAETASIDTQKSDIVRYCKAKGWALEAAEAVVDSQELCRIGGGDIFVDAGISGSKGKTRPQFEALMKLLTEYDRVVVWKIDRLTRRLSELGDVLDAFSKASVVLVGISDGVDTSTSAGRTTAEILGTIASAESRNTTDRVLAAQRTKSKEGKWRGGPPPYGYAIERQDNASRLVIDPAQAKHLRFAAKRFIKGDSIGSICRALNDAGVRSVFGNPWSEPVLRRLLGSPAIAGFQVLKGEIVHDDSGNPVRPYPPVVDLTVYMALQDAMKSRAVVHPQHGGALVSGFVFCGLCGGRMIGASSEGSTGANYRCRNRYQLNKSCTGVVVRSKSLEPFITEVFFELLENPKTRKRLLRALASASQSMSKSLSDAKTQYDFHRSRLRHLDAQHADGKFAYAGGVEDFSDAWDAALGQVQEAETALKALSGEPSDPRLSQVLAAQDLREEWKLLTLAERRAAVNALMRKITINPTRPGWNSRQGFDHDRVVIEFTWSPR